MTEARDGRHTVVTETGPLDQPAAPTIKRGRWRGDSEVHLRDLVERWGRARWPEARVCHELVMNRGSVRLDVAFISPTHLAVVELKSGYDTMDRAMHQCGMARLCAHEVWLVTDRRHAADTKLLRYLLPSIGTARSVAEPGQTSTAIEVTAEPDLAVRPHPLAMASVLWVAELARAIGIGGPRPGTHAHLAARLAALPPADLDRLVCRELRHRDALWRADPPLRETA